MNGFGVVSSDVGSSWCVFVKRMQKCILLNCCGKYSFQFSKIFIDPHEFSQILVGFGAEKRLNRGSGPEQKLNVARNRGFGAERRLNECWTEVGVVFSGKFSVFGVLKLPGPVFSGNRWI